MADTLRERFEDVIRPWKKNPALSVSDIVLDFVRAERRRFAKTAATHAAVEAFNAGFDSAHGSSPSPAPDIVAIAIAAAEAEDA